MNTGTSQRRNTQWPRYIRDPTWLIIWALSVVSDFFLVTLHVLRIPVTSQFLIFITLYAKRWAQKDFFKKRCTLKELIGEVIDMWTGSYNQWL